MAGESLSVLQRIWAEFWRSPIGFLGGLASIMAVGGNIKISLPVLLVSGANIPILEIDFIFKICLFLLLEAALANVFGFIVVKAHHQAAHTNPKGAFGVIFYLIVAFISAWISAFNVTWIFIWPFENEKGAQWALFILMLISLLIAMLFIWAHATTVEQKAKETTKKGVVKLADTSDVGAVAWLIHGFTFVSVVVYFSWVIIEPVATT